MSDPYDATYPTDPFDARGRYCRRRATDRTDNLTRAKMYELLDEMKQEVEGRLARFKTVN